MREHHDTVIVGAGQAGLAMSAVLQRHGREHVVLERRRVGERWRTERWDSLRFQFPNWSLQLPGYCYAGSDPDGFAHHSDILRVIEEYAASTRAPVCEHADVIGLGEDGASPGFVVSLAGASIHARRVVLATGPFQRPLIPQLSLGVSPSVLQTDPTRYRCPEQLPAGAVLIVGSGASGCQIADELLRAGRTVYLSVSRHRRAPRRFRGRDVYWWLEKMGRFAQTIDSFPSRQWPPSTVVTGVDGGYDVDLRQLAADGVRVVGRVVGASGDDIAIETNANQILDEADRAYGDFLSAAREFAAKEVQEELAEERPVDRTDSPAAVSEVDSLELANENIDAIIWATGYTYDFGWVRVPVLDNAGRPVQRRGVTQRPGLYFLGLHWMHTFKSGLLAGVGGDAEYLAEHIARSPRGLPE
jgi:putative flavoprotein involved in K+ transport